MFSGVDIGLSVTSIITMNDKGKILFKSHFGSHINESLKNATHTHLSDRYRLYTNYFCNHFESNKVGGTVLLEFPMGAFRGNALRIGELFGIYAWLLVDYTTSDHIFFPRPGEIKKYFTGNGIASKDQMIEECKFRGYIPRDHHEADAIAACLMGIEKYSKITLKKNQPFLD